MRSRKGGEKPLIYYCVLGRCNIMRGQSSRDLNVVLASASTRQAAAGNYESRNAPLDKTISATEVKWAYSGPFAKHHKLLTKLWMRRWMSFGVDRDGACHAASHPDQVGTHFDKCVLRVFLLSLKCDLSLSIRSSRALATGGLPPARRHFYCFLYTVRSRAWEVFVSHSWYCIVVSRGRPHEKNGNRRLRDSDASFGPDRQRQVTWMGT